jgi:signal transduction histidine kinase
MTAVRIFEVRRDEELSRVAREILDGDGNGQERAHFYDADGASSEVKATSLAADIATANPDAILVTVRDAEDASALAGSIAEQKSLAPVLIFTTAQAKAELLRSGDFSAWDAISEEESNRLPIAVKHAAELSDLRRRQGKMQDELGQAKSLLLKNQKSITVGRLLGSIAHEINNPLEAVTNLLYLAQRQSADPAANDCIAMAERELQRVGEITRQMLSFHRESRTMEEISVTGAVETGLTLFETRLRHAGVVVERQYRSVGTLAAFAGELRQVFSNLFANSVDAMPNGGRLIVRVQERLGIHPTLCITVADTGVGMSRNVVQRVGDLFFTTKGETGTGLGMWVTRQLVEKHGGKMQVYSSTTPGRSGTVFRIVFTEPQARFKSTLEVRAADTSIWTASGEKETLRDKRDGLGSEMMSA